MAVLSALICMLFLLASANVDAQAEEHLKELPLTAGRLFELIDVNRDSLLAQPELESWILSSKRKSKEKYLMTQLRKMSPLRELTISLDDYLAFNTRGRGVGDAEIASRRRDFESSDANGDGYIDVDEAAVFIPKAKQQARDRAAARPKVDTHIPVGHYAFQDFVKLETGTEEKDLSEEKIELLRAKYNEMDFNQDGFLHTEEIRAFLELQEVAHALEQDSPEKIEEIASSLIDSLGKGRNTVSYNAFTEERSYALVNSLSDDGDLLRSAEEYEAAEKAEL